MKKVKFVKYSRSEELASLLYTAMEGSPPISQQYDLVEHLEGPWSGLVDGADDHLATSSQLPEATDHGGRWETVEARGWFVAEQNGRVVKKLKEDT